MDSEHQKLPAAQKVGSAAETKASAAATAFLLLVSVAGGAMLVWWALVFHPSNEQLRMVPIGLVVLGTPVITWLSLFASEFCRRLDFLCLWSKNSTPASSAAPVTPTKPAAGPTGSSVDPER